MIRASSKRTMLAALATAALSAGCTPPDASRGDRLVEAYLRLVAAEDARPRAGPALTTLTEAATSRVAFLRQVAVRALGRLENPDLTRDIADGLEDHVPAVRAEAANALAQAVHPSSDEGVLELLIERAATESDPTALAALARSIGRSAGSPTDRARAEAALLRISRTAEAGENVTALVGVALGFESLVRESGGAGLGGAAATRLMELSSHGLYPDRGPDGARVRSLAYSALGQARRLDSESIQRAMRDRDEAVRLVAARHLDGLPPLQRPEILRRLLADTSPLVTLEAIRQVARQPATALYCRYLLAGAEPTAPPAIRVLAFDALARACPDPAPQLRALREAAAAIGEEPAQTWQPHAHAFLALARLAPEEAEPLLPLLTSAEDPFVRTYGARGAALLGEGAALRRLLADPAANVRTAAAQGLFELEGHAIDELLLAQLEGDDPQLLLTVAGLLEGSAAGPSVAEHALSSFERISDARRETWRDPRRALLARIAEHGDASLSARLRPYLEDYDPLVAEDVARILGRWSGRAVVAQPRPLDPIPPPTPDEYAGLVGTSIVLHMRAGGSIVIELTPSLATTNVFRFVRLARAGYFDGLTFHRWAPNFVIQGGSPGANEYQGAGPYTRDEVGLPSHWRGTVGISTRGRDTGDAQIFINLVDNVRLNHDYTIVGRVVEGMDVVDAVLEGHVIERAEVRRPS